MGKPTGFIEYLRELPVDRTPAERVRVWGEFHHFRKVFCGYRECLRLARPTFLGKRNKQRASRLQNLSRV